MNLEVSALFRMRCDVATAAAPAGRNCVSVSKLMQAMQSVFFFFHCADSSIERSFAPVPCRLPGECTASL